MVLLSMDANIDSLLSLSPTLDKTVFLVAVCKSVGHCLE